MSLESDIKQETFESDYEKAAVNILYTGSWLYQINLRRLKKYRLTPEQYNVLRILRGSHPQPLKLSDISSRMVEKSSNCTRLVEKLRQKGFVSREVCESNRRQVDIAILPKGLALLKKVDSTTEDFVGSLNALTKKEARELSSILDKLRSQNQ
jgi:DNA-binding MarR family transcriptional regulator